MSVVLVIAPHPDDEVLGCGGTIKKRSSAGDEVHLCIVTDPYTPDWSQEYIANKEVEIRVATKVLGIKQVIRLHFPTVKLDTVDQKIINDSIGNVIKDLEPDEVYIPHIGDINMDHQIVHRASLVALRPKPCASVNRILSYEVVSETEWGNVPFIPNVYEDIGDTISHKRLAMQSYQSELQQLPHPRSVEVLQALAIKRGSEVGLQAAEAFMLIRQIER